MNLRHVDSIDRLTRKSGKKHGTLNIKTKFLKLKRKEYWSRLEYIEEKFTNIEYIF